MNSKDFVENLLQEINELRGDNTDQLVDDGEVEFSEDIIKHWLNFAVYYERASVVFIGGWLKTTTEDDAFHHLSHQLEDECNHYRYFKRHYINYTGNEFKFSPPPKWKFLMEEYYPGLNGLVERLAAHNIASETGAIGFMKYGFDKFPATIRKTVASVMKDELYHVSFGKKLLIKYCITKDLQEKARTAALEAIEHMFEAREEFVSV